MNRTGSSSYSITQSSLYENSLKLTLKRAEAIPVFRTGTDCLPLQKYDHGENGEYGSHSYGGYGKYDKGEKYGSEYDNVSLFLLSLVPFRKMG